MKLRTISVALLLVTAALPAGAVADDGRPLADAGLDQSTTVGATVYLDGGGSLDPDGAVVDYRWSIRTPGGGTVDPADPDAVTTQFVPEEAGRYRVRLTVTGDDGQTHSDTLYVDVSDSDAPPEPTPTAASTATPTATPTGSSPPSTEPISTPADAPAPPAPGDDSTADSAPNQGPTGEILGPDSVTSGSQVTYTLDATDADGEVVDTYWLPTTLSTDRAARSRLGGETRTITVDGTPGTAAEIAAIVVDDDGATTTVTKSVEVVNTPPVASIEGPGTAVVNTTSEYRLVATDPDGEITSVSLSSDAAAEPLGPMPWDGPTSSGEWARSFRFTEIPEDDGTVTIRGTVTDEHGGVTTVEKSVTVISEGTRLLDDPVAQSPPEILSVDAYYAGESDAVNDGMVRFTAAARDATSDRLTFTWKIGEQALLETADGGDPAHGNVTYAFDNTEAADDTIDVTVTVRDQYGNARKASISVDLQRTRADGGAHGWSRPVEVTSVHGQTVYGQFQVHQNNVGQDFVVSYGDETSEVVEAMDPHGTTFSHTYASAGRYAITVTPSWSGGFSETRANVSVTLYEVYTYERNASTTYRTTAEESPGERWERNGIARIERTQTGVETMQTLTEGQRSIVSPGEEWVQVGTTTEYHTERRTEEATEAPGEEWSIAERNVDSKQVFDGWRQTTVPQRGLLGGDWEYVEAVETTVQEAETKESTSEPSGDGWNRGEEVRQTQVGFDRRTVDYRFHADPDWQYVGSERYISGYDESRVCVEHGFVSYSYRCTEWETDREPEYDTRYEYRVPTYDTVYEWERTVESTDYEYRYRTATYDTKAVHEYEREVRVGTEYAQWERPVYDQTEIYRWEKSTYTWKEAHSLTKPMGDVRNLDRDVKECSAPRQPDDPPKPPKCEGGGS